MITLTETIEVMRPVESCFLYVADFRTTVEWDATAVEANKLTPGPVDQGSQFSVRCKAGRGHLDLAYEITAFTPWQCLVLEGRGRWFSVRDVITFESLGDDLTRIHYVAEFTFRKGLQRLATRLEPGFKKMGRASLKGLAKALADDNPPPEASPDTQRRDSKLATALTCFTRYGYRRGQKKWRPMTADMSGKHVVLTGANAGLGFATAVSLLEAGATLTVVVRDPAKATDMQRALKAETGREADHVELTDLSLLTEVSKLCERLHARGQPIDVLINNAGALFNDYAETNEGIERSAALLLLSPWKLTESLLPLLKDHAQPARVINVVSGGMYTQKLRCDELLMTPDKYNGSVAYARAKRALTVLTEFWAEAWSEQNIAVNSMHPGWADTPGVQTALPGFRRVTKRVLRSPAEGADTIVWLARASEADQVSGKLFLDREPRTTHLRPRTQERPEERTRLLDWLTKTYNGLKLSDKA